MKSSFRILLMIILSILLLTSCHPPEPELTVPPTSEAAVQQRSEGSGPALDRGTAFFTAGEHEIIVNYGRPDLAGRDRLSEIRPGDLWRLGMNEASEFESTSDLSFGNTLVPSGRYTIFALFEGDQSWKLVFNKKLGQWGAFEHDAEQDVARVPLELSKIQDRVERLTIGFEATADQDGLLVIEWGTNRLSARFRVQ